MTDKELLEAAVKAAGFDRWYWEGDSMIVGPATKERFWQPLASDGDALRLAVKLKITINMISSGAAVSAGSCGYVERDSKDPAAATRRAIVRVAASIGAEQ